MSFFDAGLQLAGALISSSASSSVAKAQARTAKANMATKNAQSELARTIQQINNKRAMKAAERNTEAAAENLERMKLDFSRNNFESHLQGLEQIGAYIANVSTSGTEGASVDAIADTMKLAQDRKEAQAKRGQAMAVEDATRSKSLILEQAYQGLDWRVITGGSAVTAVIPDQPQDYLGMLSKLGLGDALADAFRTTPAASSGYTTYSGAKSTFTMSTPGSVMPAGGTKATFGFGPAAQTSFL